MGLYERIWGLPKRQEIPQLSEHDWTRVRKIMQEISWAGLEDKIIAMHDMFPTAHLEAGLCPDTWFEDPRAVALALTEHIRCALGAPFHVSVVQYGEADKEHSMSVTVHARRPQEDRK